MPERDAPNGRTGDRPTVRVGRRFLPVAASAWPPVSATSTSATVALPVTPGTPVHAIAAGRVVSADSASAGELALRIDNELRVLYRRLLPSSMTVAAGDAVRPGDLLGTVRDAAGEATAFLELGASRADGTALDIFDLLTGAADPLELYLPPPSAIGGARGRAGSEASGRPAPATDAAAPAELLSRRRPQRTAAHEAATSGPVARDQATPTVVPPADQTATDADAVSPAPDASAGSARPADEPAQPEPGPVSSGPPETSANRLAGRRRRPPRPARPTKPEAGSGS